MAIDRGPVEGWRRNGRRVARGFRRRMWPPFVRADDAVHRLGGLTVSTYDRTFPVVLPLHPDRVEVLAEPEFVRSCREIRDLTLLDTPRLANLWTLSRMCDGDGDAIEVGSFKGGGALHLSNAAPDRRIIVCESFGTGFGSIDEALDTRFGDHLFNENRRERVEQLFTSRGRDVLIVDGFFPGSAAGLDLGPFSFAHLDVDVYEATRDSLEYLAERMTPRSFIVVDDHRRKAEGVDRAVGEFTAEHDDWLAIPLFPSQGLLVNRTWFDGSAA